MSARPAFYDTMHGATLAGMEQLELTACIACGVAVVDAGQHGAWHVASGEDDPVAPVVNFLAAADAAELERIALDVERPDVSLTQTMLDVLAAWAVGKPVPGGD